MPEVSPVRLSDYKPYPFNIPSISLDFVIEDKYVDVTCSMQINPISKIAEPLLLKGTNLKLQLIAINDSKLTPLEYTLDSKELVIYNYPVGQFELKFKCRINPFKNLSLEGLYESGGMIVSQCEAEGFRRICFHPDRPDVLSKYSVRIEADKKKYPVLLSNGNKIKTSIDNSSIDRHEILWEDPFPKPSYLFALVAGKLEVVKSKYKSMSGRTIDLNFYVEKGDEIYTEHASSSLKRSMLWDENVYELEYDLNEYNVVAVRHFNMGAMENKSLNIFNSKLVLSDSKIATDDELERVESVIAHEYFHNWTGNRITCRDWFQLSLKEGLTVFRDQSFTSDLHSSAVKRIDDVSNLRNTQFKEDQGPTAHAVKPTEYFSIDNFYTTTIYEKGAELIRMLQTLLGKDRFMKGIEIYINKFDGTAATTEDFIDSIFDPSFGDEEEISFDKDKFRTWYYQSGTPNVSVVREWDSVNRTLVIYFEQNTPISSIQKEKLPLVIPIRFALMGPNGRIGVERMIVLEDYTKKVVIKDLPPAPKPPILSLFRGFSAPVKWKDDLSTEEYFKIFTLDDDTFTRWEAGQILMRRVLITRSEGITDSELEQELILAFGSLLAEEGEEDPSFIASLLTLPCFSELESLQKLSNPIPLYQAVLNFKTLLGKTLINSLKELLMRKRSFLEKDWPEGQGERRLTGLAWSWLVAADVSEAKEEALEAITGNSMTLARYALFALRPFECEQRVLALNRFYEKWKDRPVVLDSWFSIQASTPMQDGLQKIKELICHPKFDPVAPNAVRAVLGGFASNSPVFHSVDGSGYMFMADQLLELDSRNPITASRMVKVFSRWKNYVEPHRESMYKAIEKIASASLSQNTKEVISLILD